MKMLEHKGKKLLAQIGIKIPAGILVNNKTYADLSYGKEKYHDFFNHHGAVVVKAQVIGGGRKKIGLVFFTDNYEDSLPKIAELYEKTYNNSPIDTLLIEQA